MVERSLNLDIAGAVSELELLLKKVLPRNIMWKIILGKGLEFDGFRDYAPFDDSSDIDWKASIRGNRTVVRKYIEERELKFMFLVDVSDNVIFGSTEKLKCEYIAEMVSAMAHLILGNGDRVGIALYNDKIVNFIVPSIGRKHFDILAYELSNPLNYGGANDLNEVLNSLIKTIDKSVSMVFLVSDFVNIDETYNRNLEVLGGLFETIALIVRDPLDVSLPDLDKEIVIGSGDERLLINPMLARRGYEENAKKQLDFVKDMFKNKNIETLDLSTVESSAEKIAGFLSERIRGGRKTKL